VISVGGSESLRATAKEIFDKGFQHAPGFQSPRAKAFAILGLCCYYEALPDDRNLQKNIASLSEHLLTCYDQVSSSNWHWFEPYLTYANPRLPQALFRAYTVLEDERYLQIAKESFDFLVETQIIDEKFVPIGNKGWYQRGGRRAMYDQQPIEASCMVDAALAAFRTLDEEKYRTIAHTVFAWFLGQNSQNVTVYDATTGACYDAITPQGLNRNQGAEATLSYLLARLELETPNH
jgi:hypothetical protein